MLPIRRIAAVLFAIALPAQTIEDALAGSRVRDHLFHLTDVSGPRVTGSPALVAARDWLAAELRAYGLRNVRQETNPPIGIGPGVTWDPQGWSWSRLSVHQVSPWPVTLIGVPVLYSAATPGPVTGDALIAPLPGPDAEAIAAFEQRHRGTLRGKFLLTRETEYPIPPANPNPNHRYSEAEMAAFATVEPPKPRPIEPPKSAAPRKRPSYPETLALFSRLYRFLREEGVLGVIGPAHGEGGTLTVRAGAAPPDLPEAPPPTFDLAPEHYNRFVRLLRNGINVRLEADLRTAFHGRGTRNLLAEIPGTDKSEEVVIAGAHLDSWHGATGATDNASGVAVLLETARILAQSNVRPRRTIRFAFWDAEELGLAGSRAYVEKHAAELPRTSCYFNLDYGTGRIRGIYLQGRTELAPTISQWLQAVTGEMLVASPRSALGSDQASFERAGVPGFTFIQDPLNYESRTHHTTMDVPDYAATEDLTHAVRVLAHVLLQAASAEELLPRTKR